jgi:hypothetical protein
LSKINLATRNSPIDDVCRGVIDIALTELGAAPEQISLELGLAAGYLRAFMEQGQPRALPNRIRRRLAAYLGVPEHALR